MKLKAAKTTDLTPGVQVEKVVGESEDGDYVYYVTTGGELKLWHDGTTSTITATRVTRAKATPDGHSFVFTYAPGEGPGEDPWANCRRLRSTSTTPTPVPSIAHRVPRAAHLAPCRRPTKRTCIGRGGFPLMAVACSSSARKRLCRRTLTVYLTSMSGSVLAPVAVRAAEAKVACTFSLKARARRTRSSRTQAKTGMTCSSSRGQN